jgi:hypothetical protein
MTQTLSLLALSLGCVTGEIEVGDDSTESTADADTDTDSDSDTDSDVSVEDIQGGSVDVDTLVDLLGVYVTGVATYSDGDGYGLFVGEAAGGAWSGIWVYTVSGAEAFAIGDAVDVRGHYIEYDGDGDWSDSVSEIDVGDYPTDSWVSAAQGGAQTVPATSIDKSVFTDASALESYEGVLVTVTDLVVTDGDLGFGEWAAGDVRVDDKIYDAGPVYAGDTFTSVTGVLDFTFDNWKLVPRSSDDIVGYSTQVSALSELTHGSLVITEVMIDPGTECSDADDEYFEVYNNSGLTVDLYGLEIGYGENLKTVSDHVVAFDGQYILFVRESPSPCYGHDGDVEFPLSLNNTPAKMSLNSGTGTLFDDVDFTGWTVTPGVAWGVDPTKANPSGNDNAANWCGQTSALGTDFGTPGAVNDSCG